MISFSFGEFFHDNVVCLFGECCGRKQIKADFYKLENLLYYNIYGQHLANKIVLAAMKSHWDSPHAQKALTLSFHGWPGSGKNYITRFIKESVYLKGSNSRFVHHFMGRVHFPQEKDVPLYRENLYNWIKGNVSECPYQIFIFDEVDKMPDRVLDVIKPMIDYNENVDKVDYRKCVFIFLSNTGGSIITRETLKLWKEGIKREDIQLKHFEQHISKGVFNEKGGFYHSDTIKSNLIDHYIPFLPMEMEHVRLCIVNLFEMRQIKKPSEEAITEVLDFIEWGPEPERKYSKTGCKRLSQKVALVAHKYRKSNSKEEL